MTPTRCRPRPSSRPRGPSRRRPRCAEPPASVQELEKWAPIAAGDRVSIRRNGELVDSGRRHVHLCRARPPLRLRRLRGHAGLRDARRPGRVSLDDDLERFGHSAKYPPHEPPALAGGAEGGGPRRRPRSMGPRRSATSVPIAFYGYGDPRRRSGGEPAEVRSSISFPWRLSRPVRPRRTGTDAEDLVPGGGLGPNSIPDAAKLTGSTSNPDAPRRSRRALAPAIGEAFPAHVGRVRRGRPEGEHLRREGGRLGAPALSASILLGTTRDTVLQLRPPAARLRSPREAADPHRPASTADELFVTGTAAEINRPRARSTTSRSAALGPVDDCDPGRVRRRIAHGAGSNGSLTSSTTRSAAARAVLT